MVSPVLPPKLQALEREVYTQDLDLSCQVRVAASYLLKTLKALPWGLLGQKTRAFSQEN